ncbi:oxidoreductase/nitrogenase component 1 [Clostridium bornimense]|uniref:Oxidoreductase/nitrogenase component 1 n=1 Tax=Clostridium bornimense TaxID=1216932 RepID=W6RT95_9CLOT|nr:nitrogenase component 1 [Clostridium bornimense]CDM67478.1 oxidoreductase/nitrogenase component 1 [Clostridium bornimense]
MSKINLDITEVESREQRLGTIIAWDGKASDLAAQSAYERRGSGCKGRGSGCKLCEVKGPFSQGSVCSEQMVECQAGNVRDAVLIQHAPIGCAAGQVPYNSIYRNGLKLRNHDVENIRIICTNLQESDMVFGALDKLKQSINDAFERYNPKAIFVSTACATGIIGEDIESVAVEMESELGIPVIPLQCEGFRSKHWSTGFDATQHGILRQIVKKNPKKQEDLVNVINLWGSDVFTPMLKELNLRVNYVVDLATVDDLAMLSEAAATVGFCYTLSSYMAAALEQEFGVPEVKAPQPYGFKGTDAWLREIAKVTHREELAEAYIEREHKRVAPRIAELREKLKGVKGYVATGSAYAHGLIVVLRELGIEVNGSLVFHHDPVYDSGDPKQDSLSHLINNYGDVPSFNVSNRQQFQLYGFLKEVKPDFMLIRHNGLAPLASRLGIPAAPLGDEHIAIGYQGIINLGEAILDVLAHKKFHNDLKEHVKLPYKKWWLDQKDPYILAKHPELIEDYKDDYKKNVEEAL